MPPVSILAQLAGDVPRLPDPPFLAHRLLEAPWPAMILFVAAGAAGWYLLRHAKRERAALTALSVGVAAAVAVWFLAAAVQTTRELLIDRTRALVTHAAAGETVSLAPMLADTFEVRPWGISRHDVLTRLSPGVRTRYAIKELTQSSLRAQIDGTNVARTQVHVRVVTESGLYNLPTGSWWIIHWRRDAQGTWNAAAIECQQIDGIGDPRAINPN